MRTALLSEAELEEWGERIGREARPPLVLALRGDLGAGKTTLARAIVHGAGIEGAVPSPTFNLVFLYESPRGGRILHYDLYRLEQQDDVWELGWEEMGAGEDLVLIEWPEHAEMLLPGPRWDITLQEIEDPERRRVILEPVGEPPPLPPFSSR